MLASGKLCLPRPHTAHHSVSPASNTPSRWQAFWEVALIFAVFYVQGAWPVPDVNEPHYLGKAIHYWNPDWVRGDFFLQSADTHQVFYFTFGWLSQFLTPWVFAWTGRVLTWALLAWGWQRLSVAIVPRRWCSVLTAALFACLIERFHMAGEWVIGGVEAKSFAYALVFFGLAALVRNRWNWALMLFGAGGAFHALVGGWAAVAAGVAWLWLRITARKTQNASGDAVELAPPLVAIVPGVVLGLLLALPGLLPSLLLNHGVDPKVVQQSHEIYVFQRLSHHLTLSGMKLAFILRLALLAAIWVLFGQWEQRVLPGNQGDDRATKPLSSDTEAAAATRRLRAFVVGAIAITLTGAALNLLMFVKPTLAADVLRYYWFRMTDVAIPMGVALEGVALIVAGWHRCRSNDQAESRRRWPKYVVAGGFTLAVLLAVWHVGDFAVTRLSDVPPRADRLPDYDAWREACAWVSRPENVPVDARFLTPRLAQTFKWYAQRSEVVNWKDVPQDAPEILEWQQRIKDLYMTGGTTPETRWYGTLAEQGAERLLELGKKYHATYMICQASDAKLGLPEVYRNRSYVVYRLARP